MICEAANLGSCWPHNLRQNCHLRAAIRVEKSDDLRFYLGRWISPRFSLLEHLALKMKMMRVKERRQRKKPTNMCKV